MLRCGAFPQSEVGLTFLLIRAGKLAALVDDIGEVTAGEDTVFMVFVVFLNIEINGAMALIGIAVLEDLLDEFLLLDDVSCGVRLYRWRQRVEHLHGFVIAVGIVLCYLHRLELLQACLLLNLVIALVGIVLEMAYIRDVAHITHLIA